MTSFYERWELSFAFNEKLYLSIDVAFKVFLSLFVNIINTCNKFRLHYFYSNIGTPAFKFTLQDFYFFIMFIILLL